VGEDGRAVLTSGGWICDRNSSRVTDMVSEFHLALLKKAGQRLITKLVWCGVKFCPEYVNMVLDYKTI